MWLMVAEAVAAGVEAGLGSSPMERLLELRGASVALRFLDEQRRMQLSAQRAAEQEATRRAEYGTPPSLTTSSAQ